MFEDIPAFSLLSFFKVSLDVFYAKKNQIISQEKYLLPFTSEYLGEDAFSEIFIAWNEAHISAHIEINQPIREVFSDFRKGDSIELFFDTRDLKDRNFISQYCHHFVFFPEKEGKNQAREVTRFRTEDMHPLCSPEDLVVKTHVGKDSYILDIEIPAFCLHGYDPNIFKRLGFSYRINRLGEFPQHFTVSSDEVAIEKHPQLWATLKLTK